MLYNINPFFKDLKEDVCLQHISILLNTINKTFKLLEQEVFVYCQDVKNSTRFYFMVQEMILKLARKSSLTFKKN